MTRARPPLLPTLFTALAGLALLASLGPPAEAQVLRCVDPRTGKVSYTNQRCDSGEQARLVEPARSEEALAEEARQAAIAQRRAQAEAARQAAAQRPAPVYTPAPSTASTSPPGTLPDLSQTHACAVARKNLATTQSVRTTTPDTRDALLQLRRACGDQVWAEAVEAERLALLRQAAAQSPPRPPRVTVALDHCDAQACWTADGQRYQAQGANRYTGPQGSCERQANWLHCH